MQISDNRHGYTLLRDCAYGSVVETSTGISIVTDRGIGNSIGLVRLRDGFYYTRDAGIKVSIVEKYCFTITD